MRPILFLGCWTVKANRYYYTQLLKERIPAPQCTCGHRLSIHHLFDDCIRASGSIYSLSSNDVTVMRRILSFLAEFHLLDKIYSGAIHPVRTSTRVPAQIHFGVRRSGSFLQKLVLNSLAYEYFRHFFKIFTVAYRFKIHLNSTTENIASIYNCTRSVFSV